MDIMITILVFCGGLILGLILHPLARLLDSVSLNRFLDALARLVVTPFSACRRFFRKKSDYRRASQDVKIEASRKVDPREQRIDDTAQTVRGILLSLATVIQRTDMEASYSSQTLEDVRSGIHGMELPPDLLEAHGILTQEIDRVISSNSALKSELSNTQQLLADQRQQIESLRTAVRIDSMTQLANRAYFDEKLTEMIKLYRRYKEPFSLMMIDVDNFKTVNDTYGHQAGDRILKGVAFKLKESLRGSDFLARFGGDEFALILVKAGAKAASDVGWKLCYSLRESRFLLENTPIFVTLSIGVAEVLPEDSEESLLKRADEALYRVKEVGRNSVFVDH